MFAQVVLAHRVNPTNRTSYKHACRATLMGISLVLVTSIARADDGADPFAPASDRPVTADPFGGDNPFGDKAKKKGQGSSVQKDAQRDSNPFGSRSAKNRDQTKRAAADEPSKSPFGDRNNQANQTAEENIREALTKKISFTWVDLPLEDAMRMLSDQAGIPILLDVRSIEEMGLSSDTPMILDVQNVKLRSALRLALHSNDLTYAVKNEVLVIMSQDSAANQLITDVHQIPEELIEKSDRLADVIMTAVHPEAWDQLGGTCTVGFLDDVMVISATEEVHEDVRDLMEKIQAVAAKRSRAKAPGGGGVF